MAASVYRSCTSAMSGFGGDVPLPSHKQPTAKVTLKKDSLWLFAGKSHETQLELNATKGFLATAKKQIHVESASDKMTLKAMKDLTIDGGTVKVEGPIKHRNLQISK